MEAGTRYIDNIAEITRKTIGLNGPIQLSLLCNVIEEKLGGRCIEVDSSELNVDAEIRTTGDDNVLFIIKYRKDMPKTRILFSIAHELGHLFLHLLKEDGQLRQSAIMERNMQSSESELAANEFAAAFLMPEADFIIQCEECKNENDMVNVTKVANYFNVSAQAATVRGSVLGLWN
jgi:Zn-dependent peptidase ImmA (M78 family)